MGSEMCIRDSVRSFAYGSPRSALLYNLLYLTVYDCTRSLSPWLFSRLCHQQPVPLAHLTKIQDAPASVERDTPSRCSYLLMVYLYDLGRMLRYSGSRSNKRQEPRAHVLLGCPLECCYIFHWIFQYLSLRLWDLGNLWKSFPNCLGREQNHHHLRLI